MKKKKSWLEQQAGEKVVSSHAWRGTWNRPLELDEDSLDPLTTARMTDHNVRGRDENGEPIAPVFEIHKDRAREQPSQRRNREKKRG